MTYIFVHSLIEKTKHDRKWPPLHLNYAFIFSNATNKSHWQTDDCIVSWIAEAVTCIYWLVNFKQAMFSFLFLQLLFLDDCSMNLLASIIIMVLIFLKPMYSTYDWHPLQCV